MKRLFKTSVKIIALMMMLVATLGMFACKDIKTLKLELQLYNPSSASMYQAEKVDFSIELYRHLSPKTVDAITAHVENGFYDGTFFYTDDKTNNLNVFIGDYRFEEGQIVPNYVDKTSKKLPSQIYGEFANNGTVGSNIYCEPGSVGLYRSYYADDSSFTASSSARDSGRATLFMPQNIFGAYDNNFCMFGKYDTTDEATNRAITAITSNLSNADISTTYVIYYTGSYDSTTPDAGDGYGLTFNCVTEDVYDEFTDEQKEGIFEAKGEQLVIYNLRKIKVCAFDKDGEMVYGANVKKISVK